MSTNDFLPFATAVGANVEAQVDYVTDPLVPIGNQAGTTAISALNNKVLRQSSVMTSQLAQYMSEALGQDVLDNGDTAAIKAQIAALYNLWGGPIDGTLAVTSGTLGVKTAGLSHLQLSASAGITRNQLNLAAPVFSGGSNLFSTQSFSAQLVPGAGASITTLGGGAVYIGIETLASAGQYGYIGMNIASYNGSNPPQNAAVFFELKRGAITISPCSIQHGLNAAVPLGSGNGIDFMIPPSSLNFIDTGPVGTPGTYAYQLYIRVLTAPSGMTVSAVAAQVRMVLKEL